MSDDKSDLYGGGCALLICLGIAILILTATWSLNYAFDKQQERQAHRTTESSE